MGLRTWVLRRAMGRLRITDDIVRYLSTLQRLGETVEVDFPGELLPVGARTVFRAVRTRAAAQLGVDWVWPYWLDRQLDPRSPAFVPRGHLPVLTNLTNRNWTMVGNVGSSREAIVDPRGLVTPWYDGWSLDWWVGADDRWHLPSREPAIRQRLIGNAPVVETAMRVAGGDIAHRVYAVAGIPAGPAHQEGPAGSWPSGELAVVELENASPVPVVVALAVRPYNPEGLAVVERIALHHRTVIVDGRPALLLPRPPALAAASTFRSGDSVNEVMQGRAGGEFPQQLRCEVGLAQAAFLFPLPHRATLRVAMPLSPARRTRRRLTRRRVERMPELPSAVPGSAAVVRSWAAHGRRGLQLCLPPGRLADAVEANRHYLLLFHDGDEITPGAFTYHRFWFRDAAYLLAAMGRYGYHAEVAEVLRSYPRRQRVDGFFFSQRQEWDANGAALWALAEHWRLTGDDALVRDLAPAVSRGVRWIERKRHARRRRDPAVHGLVPASVSAEHLGPFDFYFWDDFWSLRGLRDGAELLAAAGRAEAASKAREWAAGLEADVRASLALVAERLGTQAVPAGPRRHFDPGAIGSLVACAPLGLLRADDPAISATAELIRRRFVVGRAFFHGISHTGLGTYLTLQLAAVEMQAGDRRALERLEWLLDAATPTFTWPEAIHPQLGGGCMGDGHHGWAAAEFLSFVRNLVVREDGEGLVLFGMLPEAWVGQPLEAHQAPTHHGVLSVALRWQGDRPILLWELRPRPGGTPVGLRAPGLDPEWSSGELKGEVLFPPHPALGGARSRMESSG
ncbi:MAG TPA: hypothetical protein VKI64_07180 [Acidimicrobiales bacterium]|nr:hypothetical protein [Acidimicrobiales bacterium]